MEHECTEIREFVLNEINFDSHSMKWKLYLDWHCCSTEIKFCPYCGKELVKE